MSDKKGRRIKDKVQTVIFLCFLIIFPVFALAFCLYSQTGLKLLEVLDRSFSVSIGVFGGAATLTAAYIATLLFNDWSKQFKTQLYEKFYFRFKDNFRNTTTSFDKIKKYLIEHVDILDEPDISKVYLELKVDFLDRSNSSLQELDEFLVIIYRDKNFDFQKFVDYRQGLAETISFFEINDPLDNRHIRSYLMEHNVNNAKIDIGIHNLKEIFAIDLLINMIDGVNK